MRSLLSLSLSLGLALSRLLTSFSKSRPIRTQGCFENPIFHFPFYVVEGRGCGNMCDRPRFLTRFLLFVSSFSLRHERLAKKTDDEKGLEPTRAHARSGTGNKNRASEKCERKEKRRQNANAFWAADEGWRGCLFEGALIEILTFHLTSTETGLYELWNERGSSRHLLQRHSLVEGRCKDVRKGL